MAHLHFVEDQNGDVIDNIVYCSDSCHRNHSKTYNGWNGCHEISVSEPCASCGAMVMGIEDTDCLSDTGERLSVNERCRCGKFSANCDC